MKLSDLIPKGLKAKALSEGFFNSGSGNRRPTKGYNPKEIEPTQVQLRDLSGLRAKSQELFKNHPKAKGIIQTLTTYTIGTGLDLDIQFDNTVLQLSDQELSDLKNRVELLWSVYNKECDATGRFTLDMLQSMIFKGMLTDGESFIFLPIVPAVGKEMFSSKIRYIPAAQVGNDTGKKNTSMLQNGVVLGAFGKPTGFRIHSKFPATTEKDDIKKVVTTVNVFDGERKQMLQVFCPDFVNQYRGYPLLSTIIEPLKSGDDYSALELMAARFNAAFFAVGPWSDATGVETAVDPSFAGDQTLSQTTDAGDFGMNSVWFSNDPEKWKFVPPNRPNAQYGDFMQARHQEESMGVGLPPEVINKKYETSFSAARSAQADAHRVFKTYALAFKEMFMRPIYENFFDEAVAKGLIEARGYMEDPLTRSAYLKADFTGAAMTQLDPAKEAKAYEIYIDNNIMTKDEVSMIVTGKRFIDKADQISREKQLERDKNIVPIDSMEVELEQEATNEEE